MNFDEWLQQREEWLMEYHGSPVKEVRILRLVRAYRKYLRHLLSEEAVQNMEVEHILARDVCAKFPGELAKLEEELMRDGR